MPSSLSQYITNIAKEVEKKEVEKRRKEKEEEEQKKKAVKPVTEFITSTVEKVKTEKPSTIIGPKEQFLSAPKEEEPVSFQKKYEGFLKNADKLNPLTRFRSGINLLGYGLEKFATDYVPGQVAEAIKKHPEASGFEKRAAYGLGGVVSMPLSLLGSGVKDVSDPNATSREFTRGAIKTAFGTLMTMGGGYMAAINAIFAQPEVEGAWGEYVQPVLDTTKEKLSELPVVKDSPALQEIVSAGVDVVPWILAHRLMSAPFKTSTKVKVPLENGKVREYKIPTDRQWWSDLKQKTTEEVQKIVNNPIKFIEENQVGGSIKFVEGKPKAQIESEILGEMQVAQKPERLFTEEGVIGVKSTFPKWVPSDLRSKKLFDRVLKKVNEGKERELTRKSEKELLAVMRNEFLERSGKKGKFKEKPPIAEEMAGRSDYAMNTLAERILKSKNVSKEFKETVIENPNSWHKILKDKEVESVVSKMSKQEKEKTAFDDDGKFGTYAAADMLRHYEAKGDMVNANRYADRIEAIATRGGQTVQAQRKLAEFLTPTQKVRKINQLLGKQNRKLTEAQDAKIFDLLKREDTATAKVEQARQKALETLDNASLKKFKELRKQQRDLTIKVENEVSRLKPKKTGDILAYVVRGNLLTPGSLLANVYYNVAFLPERIGARNAGATIDFLYSKMTGKERKLLRSQPGAFVKGMGEGLVEAGVHAKKGGMPKSATKAELAEGYQPLRALADAYTGENLPISKKTGKPLVIDRMNKILEGTLGISPTVMYRGLNFGDLPFYRGSQKSLLKEYGKLEGLKGKELDRFVEAPPKNVLKEIEQEALVSTFQQKSHVANQVERFINWAGNIPGTAGMGRFAARTVVPFVKIIVNATTTALKYAVPEISMAEGLYRAVRGDRRGAEMAFGRAMVGYAMDEVSSKAVEWGVYNGKPGDSKKETELGYATLPPYGNFNLSGWIRGIAGESTVYKPGEDVILDTKTWGPFAASLDVNFEKKRRKDSEKDLGDLTIVEKGVEGTMSMLADVVGVASYGMTETFLSDVNELGEVILKMNQKGGEARLNNWVSSVFETATAVAIPNTVAGLSKIGEYGIKETEDEVRAREFGNIIKYRTFQGEDLPDMVGMYGEVLEKVPDDVNESWLSKLWYWSDPLKIRKMEYDLPYAKLYEVYQKTGDADAIPPEIQKTFSYNDETIDASSPKDYAQLKTNIGGARRELTEKATTASWYYNLHPTAQAKLFYQINKEGRELGIADYMGDDRPLTTTLLMYEAANSPTLTRRTLGTIMSNVGGNAIQETGEAYIADWRKAKELKFLMTGAKHERVKEITDRATLLRKLSKGSTGRGMAVAVDELNLNATEAAYLNSQVYDK